MPDRPFGRGASRRFGAGSSLFVLAALLLAAAPAAAHDFWIEPSSFEPEAVETVRLGLRVGDGFAGQPVRRSAEHIERFVLRGPAGERAVPGREGLDPAGLAPVTAAGAHLVGYVSTGSPITLDAERFEAYLAHEGLESVIENRQQAGESSSPGREIFVRSAKSVLCAAGDCAGSDRLLGLPLELALETDPRRLGERPIAVRLLFEGRPLPGALIRLRRRGSPEVAEGRSDGEGRMVFALDPAAAAAGPWLLTAIHMVPELSQGADWRSYWASLTLARPSDRAISARP